MTVEPKSQFRDVFAYKDPYLKLIPSPANGAADVGKMPEEIRNLVKVYE